MPLEPWTCAAIGSIAWKVRQHLASPSWPQARARDVPDAPLPSRRWQRGQVDGLGVESAAMAAALLALLEARRARSHRSEPVLCFPLG